MQTEQLLSIPNIALGDEVVEWEMTLTYYSTHSSSAITTWCAKYVSDRDLNDGDAIQFYKTNQTKHDNHYEIQCIRSKEFDEDGNMATFHQVNRFLFQLPFNANDKVLQRLLIPMEHVRKLFHGIYVPRAGPFLAVGEAFYLEFTDPRNRYQTETATETESLDNMIVSGEDSKSGYQTETATETESLEYMILSGEDSKSGNQNDGSDKMSVSGEESKPGYQTETATETESLDNMIVSGEDSKSGNQNEGSDKMSVSGEESKPGYQTETATETESLDNMIVSGEDSKSGYQTETASETESLDNMIVSGEDSKSGNQNDGSDKMSVSGEESKPGYQTETATETESLEYMIVSGEDSKSGYQTETATETESLDNMIVSGEDSKSGNQNDGSDKMSVSEEESKPGYQTETATETKSLDNMIVSGEDSKSGNQNDGSDKMSVSGEESKPGYQTETATETESLDNMNVSGEDSKSGNQNDGSDKMSVSGEESKPGDSSGESEKENMLIEKHLTRRDVEENLFFRFDLVSKHFPPPPAGRIPNAQLLLSAETIDDNDRFVEKHWDVTLTYSCADSEFVISTELRFTDSQKKDWCMKTKFDYKRDGYLVTNGWKEFLNERNLDTMHKIKLCKPALPLRKYHFLISHEKTENDGGSGTDPFQSGNNDGGSSSNIGSN
ncbi:hypothetical protein Acr_13g0001680 [Actinidia rufa]|uniref:Uncharacterized protein n=1 Tax=Actinidia rufa TaxID=165716 RepID=A0A7J0FLG1_9ERIC|nr:hypothetical protein Acr_13g0001680 [Actinidia rufa]